jgi:hypothetical protein
MKAPTEQGPVYTTGQTFRARAEARQREYRSKVLQVGWSRYGHFLDETAVAAGANFITPEAFTAARHRRDQGKGVAPRTFDNMLSSQAMCFNLFAPLALDLALASEVFRRLLPPVKTVRSITTEYTPPNDVFGDQSGRGGVDCDVLVEAVDDAGVPIVATIETKFVEPDFSICGFRKAGRAAKGQDVCPDNVVLDETCSACLYASKKGYRYWTRTWETGALARESLPAAGCPFAGPLWQLWVNHTLAHVEAQRRGAERAMFVVCAPEENEALAANSHLNALRKLVADESTVVSVGANRLIEVIGTLVSDDHRPWYQGLEDRYAAI